MTFFDVLQRYRAAILAVLDLIHKSYPYDDLDLALRNGHIPHDGSFPGGSFTFHGIGCTVHYGGYIVSWDFGPEGRTDGFEAWKLWLFTRDHPEEFGAFAELTPLRMMVATLLQEGKAVSWYPTNMVFLKDGVYGENES